MAKQELAVRAIRRGLSASVIALALIFSPVVSAPLTGLGTAQAFDFNKIMKSLQPKKKKRAASRSFGNASVRFSVFGNSRTSKRRMVRRAVPEETVEETAPEPPQLGQVTAYRYAKVEALLSGDPEQIETANSMLKEMFGGDLSERKIDSFDKLLKVDETAALLGAGEAETQIAGDL